MARRSTVGKKVPKRSSKMRVPRRISTKVKAIGPLDRYWVTCSGCFEEFELKPKDNGSDLVCPSCDHTSEPPGKAFIEQMSRYSVKERNLFLRSAVPIGVAFFLAVIWMSVLTGRSTIPSTGLTAAITADATEIPVSSTEGFGDSGTLLVESPDGRVEIIAYEGVKKDQTAFTGAIREATEVANPSEHGVGERVISKSYRTNTVVFNVFFALAIIGLFGYGLVKSFSYEKSRWSAYF